MNHFGKLFNFELNRFMKIYVSLIGLTIVSQIIGAIIMSKRFVNQANDEMFNFGMTQAEYIDVYGYMNVVKMFNSAWFMLPIVLSIGALVFYMFIIWYRDWVGKNTFIYRLLTIPTARLNVFLAKAMAIMVMVIGLVSVQLMLLPIVSKLMTIFVPSDFRVDFSVTEIIARFEFLQVILPDTLTEFIINYGIGFMVLVVIFTAVLFERSYRLLGIFIGVIYGIFTLLLFILPQLIQTIADKQLLHPIEIVLLQYLIILFIVGFSIWVSRFLLNHRVTV